MDEVQPPASYHDRPRPWLFLAGSIEMGGAPDWQREVIATLRDTPGTLLNPRRRGWDPSWRQDADEPRFREQVEWELEGLEAADVVLVYIAPQTRSPVTLLELGLHARSGRLIVCCPDGFWRRGNVDVVCRRYGAAQAPSLQAALDLVRIRLSRPGGAS